MVIQKNVDPATIAEEFIIQELIKMFPEATQEFYDKIRYFMRSYRNEYTIGRFWRLVDGFSEYMLKRHYRILKGTEYEWNLEEVELKDLFVKMFSDGRLGEIVKKGNHNAQVIGEILRDMDPGERQHILDPFKFSKDNYPILVLEENEQLIVHDGNRRTLNAAIFGMATTQAYIGRKRNPGGKPAIPESFFTNFSSVIRDAPEVTDKLIEAASTILLEVKRNYANTSELLNHYTQKYIMEITKNDKQKKVLEKVLE